MRGSRVFFFILLLVLALGASSCGKGYQLLDSKDEIVDPTEPNEPFEDLPTPPSDDEVPNSNDSDVNPGPPQPPVNREPVPQPTPHEDPNKGPNENPNENPKEDPNGPSLQFHDYEWNPNPDKKEKILEDFLQDYTPNGRPKYNYSQSLESRIGTSLNKSPRPRELSISERTKWSKVFQEIRRVTNVEKGVDIRLLFIDENEAERKSRLFEKEGIVSTVGAWSIAVGATARIHRFEKTPCAEFVSEVIRQAYQRAGYDFKDDFSKDKGNPLIFTHSALVTNLGKALQKAGWVAWDFSKYRPLIGAVMMHTVGQSPSHTYFSAGKNGLMIVDNATPQGRDLRKLSQKTLRNTYRTGVFYLPPGIHPIEWSRN